MAVAKELYNRYYGTDCAFSPDNRLILTGTHIKKEGDGKLKFLDANSLETVTEVSYPGVSVIRCSWHPKLNQIAVGLSSGDMKFYFDRELRYLWFGRTESTHLGWVRTTKPFTSYKFSLPNYPLYLPNYP